MIIEVNPEKFLHYFPNDPHPFISIPFIKHNSHKAERVLYLINDNNPGAIGLIAGIKNNRLLSPFSAPFGGFHFRDELLRINEIEGYIILLKEFAEINKYEGINLTLPPDIYHASFNAKTVSSLFRNGFHNVIPELTNWVKLEDFNNTFVKRSSKEQYRQAERNNLHFKQVNSKNEFKEAYKIVYENRKRFDRPIYMDLNEILSMEQLWPVDFFKVSTADNKMLASAIFYRNHPEVVYALFWGDNEEGRQLRAMDFLLFNLWSFYKQSGFSYIDLGISTESGIPNEGLLAFKEAHNASTSSRYRFTWDLDA